GGSVSEVGVNIGRSVGPAGTVTPEGWRLGAPSMPGWSARDLALLGNVSLGAVGSIGSIGAALLVFAILLSVFFDAMGTSVGLAREAGNVDATGNIPNLDRVLLVDALGVTAGGAGSASATQIFVESGTGIGEGARTGFASIVTGVMFLAAMFLTPLIYLVPFEAVAPALVV